MKLSYYNTHYNFGDELNIAILTQLFGIDFVEYEKSIMKADLIAIGSLFERLVKPKSQKQSREQSIVSKNNFENTPEINVFGTGFIKPCSDEEKIVRKLNLIAVRGKSTKERLEHILSKDLNVVLGDPGLLCRELVSFPTDKKKYRLGIVPHYADKKSPSIKQIHSSIPKSKIIDIQQEPISFLKDISSCDFVISSAMHGLIAADSLDIPNLRLIVSDNLTGGNYKFNDYYSVFNDSSHNNINFYDGTFSMKDAGRIVDIITNRYVSKLKEIEKINSDLVRAFKEKYKCYKIF